MRDACVQALAPQRGGTFVDATFGGGGHSRAILQELANGRLIAFDRDADAQANIPQDDRFTLIHSNYAYMENYLRYEKAVPVDGILADLGISSHHVDEAERGFSFRFDAPLDMRMDRAAGPTAADIINTYSTAALQKVFSEYGEVRNSRTLAEAIVRHRAAAAIRTTSELATVAQSTLPARENLKKYLAPVFQALRIEVNGELEALTTFLQQCKNVLAPGGRLAILTYHSLEDRIVKNFLNAEEEASEADRLIYGRGIKMWKVEGRKPGAPGEEEIEANPRARSARLRVATRLPVPGAHETPNN